MKTSTSNNQYAAANNVLIFIVSMLLGYNMYQEIYHPEKSELLLCVVLLVLTTVMVQKYGTKTEQKDKK